MAITIAARDRSRAIASKIVAGRRAESGLRKMFRAETTVDYYDREPR